MQCTFLWSSAEFTVCLGSYTLGSCLFGIFLLYSEGVSVICLNWQKVMMKKVCVLEFSCSFWHSVKAQWEGELSKSFNSSKILSCLAGTICVVIISV